MRTHKNSLESMTSGRPMLALWFSAQRISVQFYFGGGEEGVRLCSDKRGRRQLRHNQGRFMTSLC